MGRVLEFFKNKFEKWKAWSKVKKIVSIGALALVISAIVIGIIYSTKTEYATLFYNLELADSNKVVEKLKADKVPYKINGNTISVPKEKVDELRMSTLSDGTVSSGKGFELFDESAFGMTDKEANVKYQRAVQGELARAITSFDEVESATVFLNVPEETVFSREDEKGSASVTIKLKGNDTLSPEKVKAIVALISGSVKNIPKGNIEITDNKMNLLTENLYDPSGEGTISSIKQHEAEQSFEKKLETKLTKTLESMFGKNKAKVNINADLDFDSKKKTRITYDKDDVVIRSQNQTNETSNSQGGNTAAAPGTDANTGVNYPTANSGGGTNSQKTNSTVNNEIGQTEEVVVTAPGEVKRLTASVMIDANLSEAQKAAVRNMAAASVGFDTVNRRDVINVDSMIFDEESKRAEKESLDAAAREESRQNLINRIILIAVGGILLVGSIVAIIIWRRKRRNEDDEDILEGIAGTGTNIDTADNMSPIGPTEYSPVLDENEEDFNMNLEKEIRNYAAKKPEQVVDIVKTWLSEDER